MSLFSRKNSAVAPPPRRRVSSDDADVSRESRERQASMYRRGRTRAGSTGHTLRTAQPHAISAATPREKVHHLTNFRRKLSVLLSVLLFVILILAVLLQQFTASVQVSFAGGVKSASTDQYVQTIQQYLAHNPLERLRFNLDTERLAAFVADAHPEILHITPQGYTDPVTSGFEIGFRRPVVSWQVQDKLYYVDAEGVSFTKNVFGAPAVTIVDNSGVEHTAGTAIASARFLSFVGRAVALAQQNGMKVTQAAIPTGTSRQVELTLEGKPYPIIMSIDRPAGEQVEDMLRAVQFFDQQGRVPNYIDLRVKGKAFYRG